MIKQKLALIRSLQLAAKAGELVELLLIRHVAALAWHMLMLCATITDATSDGRH